MRTTIFKHNSRTYFDLYNAYIQAYPNKPTWLFEEMSGLFDFQSELMNRIATDIMDPITREMAYAFAARCDYAPVEADGATDTVTFTLVAAMVKTINAGYQVGGISPTTGKMVIYEVTTNSSSGGTATIVAPVKQIKSYTNQYLFQIDKQDDFMDFPIDGYTNIIKSTISLTVGVDAWTRVDNFDSSVALDKHFMLIYQSSGKVRIQFGDNSTGVKPALNSAVYGTFSVTEGITGKMNTGEVNINVGADSDVSSLTNAGSSGGNDSESIASIIRNSRANARLRNAVWTKEDLETAARLASSSVQKALGVPGLGIAGIYIIPSGGGLPGAPLKATVQAYVQNLTQFGIMPITANDPTYVTQNINAITTIRTGFVAVTVRNLVAFGMTLVSCAYDNQVTEYYEDNGIDLTRINVINVLWGWAFTSAENDALEFIIEQWIELLGTRAYREWGQPLEVGDLWIMGNSLYDYGVDVFTLTNPVANVPTTSVQIIDTGVVTII